MAAYTQFAFRYLTGRASHVVGLIWSRDRLTLRTGGTTMTAITSVADTGYSAGRLAATEVLTSTGSGTGVYTLATFPALPAEFYVIELYDIGTPSNSSPGPADATLSGDGSNIVYWNGTSLSDSTTAGTTVPVGGGGGDTTLGMDYATLLREIGRFLGYNRDPGEWEAKQLTDVIDIIRSGLRNFYWPLLPEPYTWTFLRPSTTLSLTNGTNTYALPTDFGGLDSEGFSFSAGSKQSRIARADEEELRTLFATDNVSGPPAYYSILPKSQVAGSQQAYEVVMWPTPDASYTLGYRYKITPPQLDGTNTCPMGGVVHAETILEACLAEAEKKMNDEAGVHSQQFQTCLATSIRMDREMG